MFATSRCLFGVALIVFAATSSALASAAGGALQCDGVNDFVTVPDLLGDFDFATTMTIEAWARYDTASGVDAVVGGFVPPDGGAFEIGRESPPSSYFSISTPGTESAYSAATLGSGVWTHIAGTYDGSLLRIYVNGVLDGTETKTGNVSDVTEVRLCRYPRNVPLFHPGAIDEVRLWNVVRSAAQIHDNYQPRSSATSLVWSATTGSTRGPARSWSTAHRERTTVSWALRRRQAPTTPPGSPRERRSWAQGRACATPPPPASSTIASRSKSR